MNLSLDRNYIKFSRIHVFCHFSNISFKTLARKGSIWWGLGVELGVGGSLGHLESLPAHPNKEQKQDNDKISFFSILSSGHIVNIAFYQTY